MAYNLICNRRFLLENNIFFKEGIVYEDVLWTPQVIITAQKVYATPIYVVINEARKKMLYNEVTYDISIKFGLSRLIKEKLGFKYFKRCLLELNFTKLQRRILKVYYFIFIEKRKSKLKIR